MKLHALHTAAGAALESAINRALALDPASRQRLRELDGHSFKLASQQPQLTVVVTIAGEELLLGADSDARHSTTLSGDWSEFLAIAMAEDPAAALINGKVQVSGDTAPLLELRNILADVDIDWEQPLSQLLGDVAAHQIGRGLRRGQQWLGQTVRQLHRQFSEFIREESQLSPHPVEIEDFYREIEQLAARSERLQARVRQIQQRIAQLQTKS